MPPTKAAVSLFSFIPNWKVLQIFINIAFKKEKLKSSPHPHTVGYNCCEVEMQNCWQFGEAGGCLFRIMQLFPQHSRASKHLSYMVIDCQCPGFFLDILHLYNSTCKAFSCFGEFWIYQRDLCKRQWGNVIKWLRRQESGLEPAPLNQCSFLKFIPLRCLPHSLWKRMKQ